MLRHHTKDEGDLGVAKVHSDLVSQGFTVLFPATAYAPSDLVAYHNGVFNRLQIKPVSAGRGREKCDRHGVHLLSGDRRSLVHPTS